MTIEYVVKHVEVLDPEFVRLAVEIKTAQVVNGYGGGIITITSPLRGHREVIETAVLRKFTHEVAPQQHELVLNGDCTKVEMLEEELDLFDAQRREQARGSQEERASEREQEPPLPIDEAQEGPTAVDAEGQADVSDVAEEQSKG